MKIDKGIASMFIILIVASLVVGYLFIFNPLKPNTQQCGIGNNEAANNNGQTSVGEGKTSNGNIQNVYVRATSSGTYDKETITVKKGIPVRFHFSADNGAGCGRAIVMEAFNVRLTSRNGEDQVAEFTPTKEGEYPYHCGMWMFVGKMIVTA